MTTQITLNGHSFYSAFARVALAADIDETLPILQVVKLTASGNRLHMIATDRYRIHAQSVEINENFPEPVIFFIPATVVRDIKRFGWHKARDTGSAAVLRAEPDLNVTISSRDETEGHVTTFPAALTGAREYPKIEKILLDGLTNTTTDEQYGFVSVDPRWITDLDKARRLGHTRNVPMIMDPPAQRRGMIVAQLDDDTDFRAVIMSVRLHDASKHDRTAAHEQVAESITA